MARMTCQPDEAWMTQLAWNPSTAGHNFFRGMQ